MSYPNPFVRLESACHAPTNEDTMIKEETQALMGYAQRVSELNEELGKNKLHTFFMRVNSDAMATAGIGMGDIIVVDRSIEPASGVIVVASVNGKLLIRRYEKQNNKVLLAPQASKLSTIEVELGSDCFAIWGVVTFVIHAICQGSM